MSPHGEGHKLKPMQAATSMPSTDANKPSSVDKPPSSLVTLGSKSKRRQSLVQEHAKSKKSSRIHKLNKVLRKRYGEHTKMFTETHTKYIGQVLRGVLDFYGYAFALHMDRATWKKRWVKPFLADGYYEASGEMSFKLLRYPANVADQKTVGRADFHNKANLQDFVQRGWAAVIKLEGTWYDQTMHFDGKAITTTPDALNWLNHAMMPWKNIDMHFDGTGAHCRFDWDEFADTWHDKADVLNLFHKNKAQRWKYGLFRLDAMPVGKDSTKIFVGETFARKVLSVFTLRLDDCSPSNQTAPPVHGAPAAPRPQTFQCPLEIRPISVSDATADLNRKMYDSAPYGSTGKGNWFTFMGMPGWLTLDFSPNRDGNFFATPVKSECWGEAPCPFIVSERFNVQFLQKLIVLHQASANIEAGSGNGGAAASFMLYPIFDDAVMSSNGDPSNQQGWNQAATSVPPVIPQKPEELTPEEEVEEPPPKEERGSSSTGGRSKDKRKIKRQQKEIEKLEKELEKTEKQMESKLNQKDDQIAELNAEVKEVRRQAARKSKKLASEKHVEVANGETLVVVGSADKGGIREQETPDSGLDSGSESSSQ